MLRMISIPVPGVPGPEDGDEETPKALPTKWHIVVRLLWIAKKLQPLYPYLGFLCYAFGGAALLYAAEVKGDQIYFRRTQSSIDCIATHGYWAAFFYVIAASSTIGFGNVYPCTTAGRTIGITYSMLGIPLVVWILTNVGKHLCSMLIFCYPYFLKFVIRPTKAHTEKLDFKFFGPKDNNSRSNLVSESSISSDHVHRVSSVDIKIKKTSKQEQPGDQVRGRKTDKDDIDVPISVGILLTLVCVALASAYYFIEEKYDVSDAIYYGFMTYLGGDYVTKKFFLVGPMYILIFLGFSMLSLTITIVQNNVKNLLDKVKDEVLTQVRKEIQMRRLNMEKGFSADDIDVDKMIQDILSEAKAPFWMKYAIPKNDMKKLKKSADSVANKKDCLMQTEPIEPAPRKVSSKFSSQNKYTCKMEIKTVEVGTEKMEVVRPDKSDGTNPIIFQSCACLKSPDVADANEGISPALQVQQTQAGQCLITRSKSVSAVCTPKDIGMMASIDTAEASTFPLEGKCIALQYPQRNSSSIRNSSESLMEEAAPKDKFWNFLN